ncbi:MAG: glycosyltransferase family 2 protein [Deltaproteobacteria bacterium]|nr:glycosyltransferase family 2 protein [Deltaproteobacteria bacterium]
MLSVLVPSYNESRYIAETVGRVRATMDGAGVPYEIIVIDDGSSDDTGAKAEATGVTVLRHPTNLGYGRALKTGMRRAAYDWCAILDADGSYPIERLPDLLAWVPRFDMVVGARRGKHYWGGASKRWARTILLRLVTFAVGTRVPDVNSGMRIFRKDIALAHVARISSGFSFTTTLTLAMLLDEHFVRYEPIDYFERVGESKVRMGRDSLRMLQIVTQAILYYNPLKVFLPICFAALAVGASLGLLLAAVGAPVAGVLALAVSGIGAIVVGALGLVAEAIRLHRAEKT